MSDLFERQPPDAPRPRFAPEQGLASLFIGAVMFITAPLVASSGFFINNTPQKGKLFARSLDWLPYVGTTLPILLGLFGAYLGVLGVRRARREAGSTSLPYAGLLLNLTGLLLWGLAATFIYFVVYGM
jgi:hypothetical protein